MADFSEYMNKPLGDMKRVTLPKGHYFALIRKHGPKESAVSHAPMYVFQFGIQSAGDDVDTSALPENFANKVVSMNCMMAEDFGQDAIGEVIRAVVPDADPAQPWGQYLPRLDNQPVKIYIDHRKRNKEDTSDSPEMTEDVKKVLPAA